MASVPWKVLALTTLVIQTSVFVLLLRFTRIPRPGEVPYLTSTTVFNAEVVKLAFSLLVHWREHHWRWRPAVSILNEEVFHHPLEMAKTCVPAFLYVVQNNLLFLALGYLNAVTYQVLYQLKILTTAMFSVALLKKTLSSGQWVSLITLMFGVVLVQVSDIKPTGTAAGPTGESVVRNQMFGSLCVLFASVTSGFSGVYFEKVLKGSKISLCIRNIQLALWSILFCFFFGIATDLKQIGSQGFFQGYNVFVWAVVFLQAFGGLLVSLVIKYTDNIAKVFGVSLSIVVSGVVSSIAFEDISFSLGYCVGASVVIMSAFIYGTLERPRTFIQHSGTP